MNSNATHSHFFVIGTLQIGGAERHVAWIAQSLRARGGNPLVYAFWDSGPLHKELVDAGVSVRLGPGAGARKDMGTVRSLWTLFLACLDLKRILKNHPGSPVAAYLPMSCVVAGIACMLARHMRVVMARRSLNHYQKTFPVLGVLEGFFMRRTQLVLANSKAVAQELLGEGVDSRKIRLIYNGIPDPEHHGRQGYEEGFRLVLVANLIRYKGHVELLRALQGVHNQLPKNWRLDLIGSGPMRHLLEELTRNFGLTSHVHFQGNQPKPSEWLERADVGLLVSHEEGFSNALLEGMAAGLPMIVTSVGGNAEAIENGISGLVVPPRDSKALGQAIVSLAVDKEKRTRLGVEARRRFEMEFQLKTCILNYEKLFEELGAQPSFATRPEALRSSEIQATRPP